MKIFGVNFSNKKENVNFDGTRTLRNTVSQLAKNNKYSLNEPNQRYITNSITELGKISGEKNIKFLLKTAAKTTYSTNIKLEDSPKNDWVGMLLGAAAAALAITPLVNKTEFAQKIQELSKPKQLIEDEKQILAERETLLKSVDLEQIKKETVGGIKDFERNLDYFIVSSETTLAHKKYVLNRLNYFMSDKYKINPQLKDKKSIAVAEMVNDMAIFTPGHKIPNIKAVNQKQHGMCAAISIVRKKLAYEDKPNYIDSIISELDASEYIKVYDRSKLGTGKRTLFRKVPIDFDAALAKGYRIIDASTTQWMHLAGMSGYSGITFNNYSPFDKENFDVKADSFYNAKFEDSDLSILQEYYQALLKASELMEEYKAAKIKKHVENMDKRLNAGTTRKTMSDIIALLSEKVGSPKIAREIINLEYKYSDKIKHLNGFEYIENEEDIVKKDKIRNFILSKNSDADIDDKTMDSICDLVNYYHSIGNSNGMVKTKNYKINKARTLYELGASNRYQFVKGLEDDSNLKQLMLDKNIPIQETLILDSINTYIRKLKENSADSKLIIKSLCENANIEKLSKQNAIRLLQQVKKEFNNLTTKEFDSFFQSIMFKNQKHAFSSYLKSLAESIKEGNNETLIFVADRLKTNKSAEEFVEILETMAKKVKKGNKQVYESAYNSLGNSSKILFVNDLWKDFLHKFSAENNDEFMIDFVAANQLDLNENPNAIAEKFADIEEHEFAIEYAINQFKNLLEIRDLDGNILYSADPAEVALKKLENEGTIVSTKDLKELQTHMDKIQKDRSTDEFNSRQGKLKDKSLYIFSKTEKAALDTIENNINPVYRYIQKQLNYMQKYIKSPLEELKRMVGVDMGRWWVAKEGSSGLYTGQSIRVLEYITGRPHYVSTNLKKAIEEIKTSPYSGITTSSVYHDKPGMHAQYIADIEPVKIKETSSKGKVETKTVDVLFQDNSWGASEHENTWVDSNGLVRTDYSDHRGGSLGYITNDKYRNGNLVNRITGEMILESNPEIVDNHIYKRIKRNWSSEYKLPQYTEIILDGDSHEAKSIAGSIHDSIFVPSMNQIKGIKNIVKGWNEEQIKAKIKSLKYTASHWEDDFDELMKRALSKDSSTAIKNEDDYNRLPDNDPLKVKLEKAALKKRYKITDMESEIAQVSSVKGLDRFRKLQRQRAVKDFKYSFGKDRDIVSYLVDALEDKDIKKIDEVLDKHKIELSDKEYNEIFGVYEIGDEQYNGSLKTTLEGIIENINIKLQKIPNENARQELLDTIKHTIPEKIYFKSSDIKNPELKHLIEFIDRVYNPDDNASFVRTYRKIQNMTNEEFEKEVLSKVTDKDLGIKEYTGYEILQSIQRYEEKGENSLRNAVWADALYTTTEPSKHYVKYAKYKLYRKPKVMQVYNFDSSYREMKNDLSLLELPKLFDKYKARNLDKYGAYPAYPKIEYMSESMFQYGFNTCVENIPPLVSQINAARDLIKWFGKSDILKNYMNNVADSDVLSVKQYHELNNVLGEISTYVYNDESQVDLFESATQAMEIEQGAEFGNYKKYIEDIIQKIDKYKEGCPIDGLEKQIENNKIILAKQSELFIRLFIRDRYQDNVYQTLQNYKNSLIRNSKTKDGKPLAEIYKEQLWDEFHKYHILQTPEEALDKYVCSLAEDSPLHNYQNSFEVLLHRALGFATLYDIQSTLMEALDEGVEADVKNEFKNIELKMSDGTVTNMGDAKVIYSMVQSLILDYQEETALRFLDKFGLNEIFIEAAVKEFNYDEQKQFIDDLYEKRQNYSKFGEAYKVSLESAYNALQRGVDYVKTANKLKRELSSAAKECKLNKKDTKEFLKSIDEIKETCAKNPQIKQIELFNVILTKAITDLENALQEDFANINSMLSSTEVMARLVNSVNLKKKSNAYKLREEFAKQFQELVDYHNMLYEQLEKEEGSEGTADLQASV